MPSYCTVSLPCMMNRRSASWLAAMGQWFGGVCKRLLHRPQDAEDAFQATFLVLVRKSSNLLRPEQVGPWLHVVATRTASRLRAEVARRYEREQTIVEFPVAESTADRDWRDLRPVLDEEVDRLPAKYRAAVVLCHLQGLTNEEAARRLGCPKGTVLSRLSRGREILRRRLTQRGLGLSVTALAVAVTSERCSAAVPAALCQSTIRLSLAFALGIASGAVPIHATVLAEGVLKSMYLTQLKLTVAVAMVLAAAGMGSLAFALGRAQPPATTQEATNEKQEPAHEPGAERQPIAPEKDSTSSAIAKRKPLKIDASDDELRKLQIGRYNEALGEVSSSIEMVLGGSKQPEQLLNAARRMIDSGMEVFDKPQDRIDLLNDYFLFAKDFEKIFKAQFEAGRVATSDMHLATYYRMDAEIQLLKARRAAEKPK